MISRGLRRPLSFKHEAALAFAHFVARRYAKAIEFANMNASAPQNAFNALAIVAASCAFTGQMERVQETMIKIHGTSFATGRKADTESRLPNFGAVSI
jgi:hypothetical protein